MAVPFLRDLLQRSDAHIQFEADQQYEGIEIDQQHQDEDGSDGTVEFIVLAEIGYIPGETDREQ